MPLTLEAGTAGACLGDSGGPAATPFSWTDPMWEKFVLASNGVGVALRAMVNGKFVTAEGDKPLIARADAPGSREEFELVNAPF